MDYLKTADGGGRINRIDDGRGIVEQRADERLEGGGETFLVMPKRCIRKRAERV